MAAPSEYDRIMAFLDTIDFNSITPVQLNSIRQKLDEKANAQSYAGIKSVKITHDPLEIRDELKLREAAENYLRTNGNAGFIIRPSKIPNTVAITYYDPVLKDPTKPLLKLIQHSSIFVSKENTPDKKYQIISDNKSYWAPSIRKLIEEKVPFFMQYLKPYLDIRIP